MSKKKPLGVNRGESCETTAPSNRKRTERLKTLYEDTVKRRAIELGILIRSEAELDASQKFAAESTGDDTPGAFTARDEVLLINAQVKATYKQIKHAVERYLEGGYGSCEGCERDILMVRMNAIPWATTCVKCQTEKEVK